MYVQAQGGVFEGFTLGVGRERAGKAALGKFWKVLKAKELEFSKIISSHLSRRET